jgi:hypothetical protein
MLTVTDVKEDRRQTQIDIKSLLGLFPGGIKQCHNGLQELLYTYLTSFNSEKKKYIYIYTLYYMLSCICGILYLKFNCDRYHQHNHQV